MRNKREKFVSLAEARVNKALKDIQLIGNLSNKAAYDYADADVKKIFVALQRGVEAAKSKFSPGGESSGGEFRL